MRSAVVNGISPPNIAFITNILPIYEKNKEINCLPDRKTRSENVIFISE